MCSIFGALSLSPNGGAKRALGLTNLIMASASRGRDSHGFVNLSGPNDTTGDVFKSLGPPTRMGELQSELNVFCFLGNCRAEPTTEFLAQKSPVDTQPYFHKGLFVVHNGTIANDKELAAEYNIPRVHNVDSEVLPQLLYGCTTEEEVQTLLSQTVKGSFALAAWHPVMKRLILATNFKPLWVKEQDGMLYFGSLEEHLEDSGTSWVNKSARRVPHYSVSFVDPTVGLRSARTLSLYPKAGNRVLVIASSGLDSTVAASWAVSEGYDVELLHFSYGCHATSNELHAVNNVADSLGVKLHTIETDFFKRAGGSTLVVENPDSSDQSVISNGEAGAELAHEWVPARNLVFLSLATAFAEARGFDYIVLGGNLEESGAYADNEYSFQRDFEALLPGALNLGHQVRLLIPLGNLMKREIVELGIKLGAPLDLTWSCYRHGALHCGNCGPCYMRRTAFKMANQPEVIEYES